MVKNKVQQININATEQEKNQQQLSQRSYINLNQNQQEIINRTEIIEQYKQNVMKNIIRCVTILILLSFLSFIIIKIMFCYNDLQQIQQAQSSYLQSLMKIHLSQVQDNNIYLFSYLDNVANILQMNVNSANLAVNSSIALCSQNVFLCRNSNLTQKFFQNYVYSVYPLIQVQLQAVANNVKFAHTFVFTDNNNASTSIVQFNSSGLIQQNSPFLNTSSISSINTLTFSFQQIENIAYFIQTINQTIDTTVTSYLNFNNQRGQQYNWIMIHLNQDKYQIICSSFFSNDLINGKVCIIVSVMMQFPFIDNILFYKTWVQTIVIKNATIQVQAQPDTQLFSLYDTFSGFIQRQVTPLYPQFDLNDDYMLQCLKFHDQFYQIFLSERVQTKTFRCFNTYIHLLMPKYLSQWAFVKVSKVSQSSILYSSSKNDDFKLQYFILSNATYFQNSHKIIVENLYEIENSIKITLIIVLIVIFFINNSAKIIDDNIVFSFKTIHQLSQIIKNNQNSSHVEEQFQKKIKQLPDKNLPIFQNIVSYFNKFIWIKKLYSAKYINKKGAILMEGLRFFKYESDNKNIQDYQILQDQNIVKNYKTYPSVLIFIYVEMIHLQIKRIQKLKSLKVIPAKRRKSKDQTCLHILKQLQDQPIDDKHQNILEPNINEKGVHQFSQIYTNKQRKNRGVRFSNQIQLNAIQKKSKFRRDIGSNSTLGKKSSLKSVKSIENQIKRKVQQFQKSSKSQQDSVLLNSSKRLKKKQTTINKILNGQQSVHEGIKSIKFDQTEQHDNNHNDDESESEDDIKFEIGAYSSSQLAEQMLKCYMKIIQYYQFMINIRLLQFESKFFNLQQKTKEANKIYQLQIQRFMICGKFLKIVSKHSIQLDSQIDINFQFDLLEQIQELYEIQNELLERAAMCKMRISIFLGNSISFKQLQSMSNSQITNSKLQANYIYAQQLAELSPHLDLQVINRCCEVVCDYETTFTYKKKTIDLLIKVLQKNNIFNKQIQELELIKRFYNKKHKKFNFIADLSQSYDIFTPILSRFHQLMKSMDLMQIFNLGMNDCLEDMKLVRQILKPSKIQTFLSLFQQLTTQNQNNRQKTSSKLINPKLILQKDFNQILSQIQKDETQFSTYVVVILGADQLTNQSSIIDDANSSNNQRQQSQYLYNEINRKLKQNYFHVIVIGQNLSNFQTKQGKIKKHLKSCFELFQIDLMKSTLNEHFYQLQKYLSH